MADPTPQLSWTLRLDPRRDRLLVDYRLSQAGPERIHVLDLMTVFGKETGIELAPSALIVREDPAQEGRLLFTRGYLRADANVAFELLPGARPLAPGAILEGRAEVPLPLMRWHPNDLPRPLRWTPREAVLQIGFVPERVPLKPLALNDGGTVPAARRADLSTEQQFVHSEPLPLPER